MLGIGFFWSSLSLLLLKFLAVFAFVFAGTTALLSEASTFSRKTLHTCFRNLHSRLTRTRAETIFHDGFYQVVCSVQREKGEEGEKNEKTNKEKKRGKKKKRKKKREGGRRRRRKMKRIEEEEEEEEK